MDKIWVVMRRYFDDGYEMFEAQIDYGFFVSEEIAQSFCDRINDATYKAYVTVLERNNKLREEKFNIENAQRKALLEAGLPLPFDLSIQKERTTPPQDRIMDKDSYFNYKWSDESFYYPEQVQLHTD